jgi:hypothetical protein
VLTQSLPETDRTLHKFYGRNHDLVGPNVKGVEVALAQSSAVVKAYRRCVSGQLWMSRK